MRHANDFSTLVGDIYDAALDPDLWPETFAASARYVGGEGAGLVSSDTINQTCVVHDDHSGFNAGFVELYQSTYFQFDPITPSPLLPTGRPTSVSDYLSEREFRGGRFYQEWLEPQGWIDGTSIVLEKSATSCTVMVVARQESRGLVDNEMSRRIQAIAPHMRRAIEVRNAVNLARGEAAAFTEMLDGFSAGVFLVDAKARIVHANLAGRSILGESDLLYTVRDRLSARDAAADRTFKARLAAAARGDAADAGGVSVPLTSADDESYVAHVLPLVSARKRQGDIANSAVAALFVRKAAVETPSLPQSVARHFRLTPTEVRVLLAIVEIGGGPEVADALGLAASTVKTHLHRIFQKTETRRQTDLVKLVAGFSTPLLS